jgi:hypothetical protein
MVASRHNRIHALQSIDLNFGSHYTENALNYVESWSHGQGIFLS